MLSSIGFGAFKIGRNQGAKYARAYELPDDESVDRLLHSLPDLGINYIDTAPAYGFSEERIGRAISHRKPEFVISTKVGETFSHGRSTYDFSERAIRESIARSRERLVVDALDIVFIHSDGDDVRVLNETAAVETLLSLKNEGAIKSIGFSGKTVAGAKAALDWSDAIMVEYHLNDRSHEAVIAEAAKRGVGVVVKKGLASGTLDAAKAIQFVLKNPGVTSLVIGGLNLEHIRENVLAIASA
jgi:aryl-alcohol dehydrogenase-like predicted oxidoreductase